MIYDFKLLHMYNLLYTVHANQHQASLYLFPCMLNSETDDEHYSKLLPLKLFFLCMTVYSRIKRLPYLLTTSAVYIERVVC